VAPEKEGAGRVTEHPMWGGLAGKEGGGKMGFDGSEWYYHRKADQEYKNTLTFEVPKGDVRKSVLGKTVT